MLEIFSRIDATYLQASAPYKTKQGYAFSGQLYRNHTTYEDLYHIAEIVRTHSMGLLGTFAGGAVTSVLTQCSELFPDSKDEMERAFHLGKLCSACCNMVNAIVAERLDSDHIVGLDLIAALARSPEVDKLGIVTLNHDVLVEKYLEQNDIRFADGFGAADGEVRWFEDRFADSSKVEILKLHGSIDWYGYGAASRMFRPAGRAQSRSAVLRDASGTTIRDKGATPRFLTGGNKAAYYSQGIFSDMLFQFQRKLREESTILMSGYGWGDVEINFYLEGWLDRSPSNRLVIMHEDPQSLVRRSNILEAFYYSYLDSKRIVVIEDFMQKVSFEQIRRAVARP